MREAKVQRTMVVESSAAVCFAPLHTPYGRYHRTIGGYRLALCQSKDCGLGGRGWTERSEGSPGGSGYRPPTPATRRLRCDKALASFQDQYLELLIDLSGLCVRFLQRQSGRHPRTFVSDVTEPRIVEHGAFLIDKLSHLVADRHP